ncbi:Crp/Fnr family transcriptional regulator [Hymenobacter sp. PAMC 26628]|uniref:Crp/Fnr family transcriptional regulator n=1 Tax=Hymenobacter sp. PAMC 26628 TaxID=1484118 RepID=UPI00077035C5|nr:Crp/Fnr family transcriptional regulator [Hymenobacter sp. PAMC 26628]AMJ65916.1 Crp/Fnr family transcriptional regulator [Hymenobacter sp. PAMC 26628]
MDPTNANLLSFLQSTGTIAPPQAVEIAAHFTPRTLEKHQFLLQAGRISDDYLFLDHGLLRAFVHDPDGNDVTTGFYTGGQVVFEVASFFNRPPARESIQALTDCAGWGLSFQQLNALFHARSEFREFGRGVLVGGFAALKDRMLAAITEPAAARYEHLIRAHPEIAQHAPLKHIASYLSTTDTSLSRIRKGPAKK